MSNPEDTWGASKEAKEKHSTAKEGAKAEKDDAEEKKASGDYREPQSGAATLRGPTYENPNEDMKDDEGDRVP